MELKIDYSMRPVALVLVNNGRTVERLDLDPNQVITAERAARRSK